MEVTLETLNILVVLLPGFVSSTILNMLIVRKPKGNLSKLIEALVFSFLIYVTIVGVAGVDPMGVAEGQGAVAASRGSQISPRFLVATTLAALLLPLILGFLATNDLHMRVLRYCRITAKTSRATTWLDVFMDQERYVIVNLRDGRRVFGWPMYFADNQEDSTLYLFNPAWVNEDRTYTPLDIHGLFLVERGSIESIEFTNVTKGNAVAASPEGERHEQQGAVRS